MLNENPIAFHLWYLQAYVYALGVFLLLAKYHLIEKTLYAVPLLLLTDVLFGKYGKLFMGEVNILYLRNFLFVGLPYILIGYNMRKYQDKINRLPAYLYFLLALASIILAYTTNYYLQKYGFLSSRDQSFTYTILSICIFSIILKDPSNKNTIWSELGRKYSLPIYIFHIFIGAVLATAAKHMGILETYSYVAPILVVLSSIIFTYVIRRLGIHI